MKGDFTLPVRRKHGRRRWTSVLSVAMGVGALLLAACSSNESATSSTGSSSTLRIGVAALPTSMDPQSDAATNVLSWTAYNAVFDALTSVDANGDLEPALALSWKSTNPTTWEFKLRKGVKFQDGEPFNASAAVFTIKRLLSQDTSIRVEVSSITGATAVGTDTLDITTSRPDSILPRRLALIYMLPPKYMQGKTSAEFSAAPIGTGPYKFVSYSTNQQLVLQAWPGSWRGAPKISRIEFLDFPDPTSAVSALQAGEIDLTNEITPDNISMLKSAGFKIYSGASGGGDLVQFGLNPTRKNYLPELASPLVRQALNYAVNKEAIITSLEGGVTKALPGQLFGPGVVGYSPKIQAFPYDPAKARSLLAQAGYPNGFSMTLQWANGLSGTGVDVAQSIAQDLAAVGVKVKLDEVDRDLVSASNNDGTSPAAQLTLWTYAPAMDADIVLTRFLSNAVGKFYANPTYDKLVAQEESEFNPSTRQAILEQIDTLLYQDPIGIYLYEVPQFVAASSNLQGFTLRLDSAYSLTGLTFAG
jgi:peptide/nickel transport system substrate-binding protein